MKITEHSEGAKERRKEAAALISHQPPDALTLIMQSATVVGCLPCVLQLEASFLLEWI